MLLNKNKKQTKRRVQTSFASSFASKAANQTSRAARWQLESENFRKSRSRAAHFASWNLLHQRKSPTSAVDENRAKGFSVEGMEIFLVVRFGWMRVLALREVLAKLLAVMRRRAVGPIVFKQILRAELQQQIEAFKELAELPGRAARIPAGYLELLADMERFLRARSGGSWRSIMEQGKSFIAKINLPATPGPLDYAMSLAQLMRLGLRINTLVRGGGPEGPSFCKLCWRINLLDQVCCPVHSASKKPRNHAPRATDVFELARSGDSYFHSRRLQRIFAQALNLLENFDKKYYVRSELQGALQEQRSLQWLQAWRPHVFAAFGDQLPELASDGNLVEWLRVLDFVPNESDRKRAERQELHDVLSHNRPVLFKVIQRAEAWLMAARLRRRRWGGARKNAGRK